MAEASIFPRVVLLEPSAIVVDVDTAVEVHLDRPAPADPPMCVVIFKNDRQVVRIPLAAGGETVVRCQLEASAPSVIDICVGLQDGHELGPKGVLLVLPRGPCDELCDLLRETVDHVKGGNIEEQSEFMELPQAEIEALAPDELVWQIQQSAWGNNSQKLAKDLGIFLKQLSTLPRSHLPPPVRGKMHKVLRYLIENKSWEATSFVLRASLDHGVPIGVGGTMLGVQDVQPEGLQILAEKLWRVFGTVDPEDG